MYYLSVEETLQALFQQYLPLSHAQSRRLANLSLGLLLANSIYVTRLARWVKQANQQASRVRFIQRLLDAPYVCAEVVYQPWLRQALRHYTCPYWHLIMDRTALTDHQTDLLSVSLAFHGRAIPLVWQCIAHGGVDSQTQIKLLERLVPLVSSRPGVIFHGDTEFGAVSMMTFVRQQGWHFILGQRHTKLFCPLGGQHWQSLASLAVSPRQACYVANVEWTQRHHYRPVNLCAFYAPRRNNVSHTQRDLRYFATSLPITPQLRRLGGRRWGTECFYRDYKSSGWQVDLSSIEDTKRLESLLTLLSVNYLWCVCVGRWLVKTGQRRQVDAHAQRHFSYFRLGWDWLLHQHHCKQPIPSILTLYP